MAKLAVRDAAQMGCEYHAQGMVGTLCVQRTEKAAGGKQSAGSQVTALAVGLTCGGWEGNAFAKSCVPVSCYLIKGQKRRDGMGVIRVGPRGWGEISQAQNPEMARQANTTAGRAQGKTSSSAQPGPVAVAKP